jgi:hypothetical protein
VRPPQLEGRRTGRPKGSKSHARAWADVRWAHDHCDDDDVVPPSPAALLWRRFAARFPDELEAFLREYGRL